MNTNDRLTAIEAKLDALEMTLRGVIDAVGAFAERMTGDKMKLYIRCPDGELELECSPDGDNVVWVLESVGMNPRFILHRHLVSDRSYLRPPSPDDTARAQA